MGDGHCDPIYNRVEYLFDAGDCCLENTTRYFEGGYEFSIPPRPCYEPECVCVPNNLICNEDQLGDGICQDHNNGSS